MKKVWKEDKVKVGGKGKSEECRLLTLLKDGMKREQWPMVRSGGKGCAAGDR